MAGKDAAYDSKDEDDILVEAKEAFKEAVDAEEDNRARYLADIRFGRLGEQWPSEIANQRRKEGRPMLTVNKMPTFIRQVVNDARQNKPSMKVRPVDSGADVETADIISGLVRHIEYNSNADIAYDTAVESAVGGGFGYIRIGIEHTRDDSFDLDINVITVADPLTVYGDPYAQSKDGSDWTCAFVTEQIAKKRFEKLYPKAATTNWDDSAEQLWATAETVQVAEYWKRWEVEKEIVRLADGAVIETERLEDPEFFAQLMASGNLPDPTGATRTVKGWQVKQCILTGAEVLNERDWPGKWIPIVPVYGDEVNVEGKRRFFSLIHAARDPQTLFNIWRTAGAELTALAPKVPYIGPNKAFTGVDAEKWDSVNVKSWPFVGYEGDIPPQRQPLDSSASGALQQALTAQDDMKGTIGLYDASLGAQSNETSGRAILARQREGDVSTFHFIDNLSRSIRQVGRVTIDLIPHVYNGERVIRMLGEDGVTVTEQPVNQPVPVIDENTGEPVMEPVPGAMPQMDPMTGQMGVPQQPKMRVFDLRQGKYDLTVSAGPSFTTRREEAATQMMELMRIYPDAAPVIGDLLAKNLDWPGADEIAERLEKMLPSQINSGIPPEVEEQIKEGMERLQLLEAENQQLKANTEVQMAEIEVKKAEIELKRLELMVKAEELEVKKFEAETDRIEAQKPEPAPAPVQRPKAA